MLQGPTTRLLQHHEGDEEAHETTPVAPRTSALNGRRRILITSVVASILLIAVGFAAGYFVKSPAQIAAEATPPKPGQLTVQVDHRTLATTIVLRGSVTPSQSLEVTPVAETGRPVVTGLRTSGGSEIDAGQVVAEVSGRPLFVLPGSVPAYRDIRPGSEGRDVEQLQDALRSLGHRSTDTKGKFGPKTKEAVKRFYNSIGFSVPTTGSDDSKEAAAAQASVIQAERALAEAEEALAGARKNKVADLKPLQRAVTYADQDLDRAKENHAEIARTTGPMVPLSELVFVSSLPAHVDKVNAAVGAQIEGPFMVISSGELVIEAQLNPADRDGVQAGQTVAIVGEILGFTGSGKVTGVGELGKDEAGRSFYPMAITPDKPLPRELAGQNLRLTVETARTTGEALVVPLSALTTNAEGKTFVTRIAGDARTEIEVAAGLSGGGFVEVRPIGADPLTAGDTVIVG